MAQRQPSIVSHCQATQSPIRIIGITGGIGMGKTTISNYLAQHHQLPVLDADSYAREAVESGSSVMEKIVERYGASVLCADGSLDRRRLGDIVFHNAAEKLWLEQQIHPYVRERIETELRQLIAHHCPTVAVVIPLLFEARMTDLVTEIWVVQVPEAQQTQRLMQRDRLAPEQIQARIRSQMAIDKKIAQADCVIDNASTPEWLFQQVNQALASPQRAND